MEEFPTEWKKKKKRNKNPKRIILIESYLTFESFSNWEWPMKLENK